jgi:Spy/CpxP family protein refolding chaperone
MKTRSKALVFAAAVLAVSAATAQPTGGYGRMGPGMMGGGYGMMGWGGPGPGGGCDFGDGAGWGHGGYYGMGPGMMGGYGGWAGAYAGLDLTADQRQKIADIEQQTRQATWKLMGTMHEQAYQMGGMGMMGGPDVDEATARKAYQAMADTRKAMFELQLDARKRIDAVLTAKQREQLQRGWGPR